MMIALEIGRPSFSQLVKFLQLSFLLRMKKHQWNYHPNSLVAKKWRNQVQRNEEMLTNQARKERRIRHETDLSDEYPSISRILNAKVNSLCSNPNSLCCLLKRDPWKWASRWYCGKFSYSVHICRDNSHFSIGKHFATITNQHMFIATFLHTFRGCTLLHTLKKRYREWNRAWSRTKNSNYSLHHFYKYSLCVTLRQRHTIVL